MLATVMNIVMFEECRNMVIDLLSIVIIVLLCFHIIEITKKKKLFFYHTPPLEISPFFMGLSRDPLV